MCDPGETETALSVLAAVLGNARETDASRTLPASALPSPGEDGPRPPGPRVHLVQHHVFQLLIVHGAKIDVGFQGLAGKQGQSLG